MTIAPLDRAVIVVYFISKDHELTRSPSPLLLVNLLRQGAAGRGWRAYRDDLGGFALGWALVIVLVIATALFLSM